MKYVFGLFTLISVHVFGQYQLDSIPFPTKINEQTISRIVQKEGEKVVRIVEFNTTEQETFFYCSEAYRDSNDTFIETIRAMVYGPDEKPVKVYQLNSEQNGKILYFEKGESNLEVNTYQVNLNGDQIPKLNTLTSLDQLLGFYSGKEEFLTKQKELVKTTVYNSFQQKLKETAFRDGKVITIIKCFYDEWNRLEEELVEDYDRVNPMVYKRKHHDLGDQFTQITTYGTYLNRDSKWKPVYLEGSLLNLNGKKMVDINTKRQPQIYEFLYNQNGLIKDIQAFNGRVNQFVFYPYDKHKTIVHSVYTYTKLGLVEKVVKRWESPKHKEVHKYTYTIDYFK